MSDTVINRPSKASVADVFSHNTKKGKGLKIERLYTNEGVHPYDEVTWERSEEHTSELQSH